METVAVDFNGVGISDGNDYTLRAARKAVRAGWMVNQDVKLRYPDGQIGRGTRVMVTAKGMEHLKREMPLNLRSTEGSA